MKFEFFNSKQNKFFVCIVSCLAVWHASLHAQIDDEPRPEESAAEEVTPSAPSNVDPDAVVDVEYSYFRSFVAPGESSTTTIELVSDNATKPPVTILSTGGAARMHTYYPILPGVYRLIMKDEGEEIQNESLNIRPNDFLTITFVPHLGIRQPTTKLDYRKGMNIPSTKPVQVLDLTGAEFQVAVQIGSEAPLRVSNSSILETKVSPSGILPIRLSVLKTSTGETGFVNSEVTPGRYTGLTLVCVKDYRGKIAMRVFRDGILE